MLKAMIGEFEQQIVGEIARGFVDFVDQQDRRGRSRFS
jgi:hypothetical protein